MGLGGVHDIHQYRTASTTSVFNIQTLGIRSAPSSVVEVTSALPLPRPGSLHSSYDLYRQIRGYDWCTPQGIHICSSFCILGQPRWDQTSVLCIRLWMHHSDLRLCRRHHQTWLSAYHRDFCHYSLQAQRCPRHNTGAISVHHPQRFSTYYSIFQVSLHSFTADSSWRFHFCPTFYRMSLSLLKLARATNGNAVKDMLNSSGAMAQSWQGPCSILNHFENSPSSVRTRAPIKSWTWEIIESIMSETPHRSRTSQRQARSTKSFVGEVHRERDSLFLA